MKKNRTVILITILALMVGSLHAARKAPGFALMDNRGQFVYKSRLKGNLLISFWASFCAPCKKEMPHLVELEKKYGKIKNMSLILINVDKNDSSGSAKQKADETLKEIGVSHVYLMDLYHMALQNYNPKKTVPATFLVNRHGYIIFAERGNKKNTLTRLERAIKKLP